jgi:hypothetical protein
LFCLFCCLFCLLHVSATVLTFKSFHRDLTNTKIRLESLWVGPLLPHFQTLAASSFHHPTQMGMIVLVLD